MEKVISLKDLLARVEALEAEVKEMRGDLVKLTHIKKELKEKAPDKPAAKPADVKDLLTQLDKAKKAGDTASAFKIRRNLRKAGYSLRDANGKK